jgi:hypothetical protein
MQAQVGDTVFLKDGYGNANFKVGNYYQVIKAETRGREWCIQLDAGTSLVNPGAGQTWWFLPVHYELITIPTGRSVSKFYLQDRVRLTTSTGDLYSNAIPTRLAGKIGVIEKIEYIITASLWTYAVSFVGDGTREDWWCEERLLTLEA